MVLLPPQPPLHPQGRTYWQVIPYSSSPLVTTCSLRTWVIFQATLELLLRGMWLFTLGQRSEDMTRTASPPDVGRDQDQTSHLWKRQLKIRRKDLGTWLDHGRTELLTWILRPCDTPQERCCEPTVFIREKLVITLPSRPLSPNLQSFPG